MKKKASLKNINVNIFLKNDRTDAPVEIKGLIHVS